MALEFPIITTFDNKAVNKADKAFKNLGKTFVAAFSTRAIINFTASSVKAFAESEKAAKRLAIQLNSVNLGFTAPAVRKYISDASLATGITESQLIPAFQKLSAVTGDVLTAQNLFNLALDVSLSTGSDLETTAIALGKAYAGNASALAKLNIGLTMTDLKGRSANDVLSMLQEKYGGKGQDAVDNFAGSWDRLSVAVGKAKEAFGAGFISGLQTSDTEVSNLQKDVINLGTALGQATAKGVSFLDNVLKKLSVEIQKGHVFFGLLGQSVSNAFAPSTGGAPGAGVLAKKNAAALKKQQDEQKKLLALQKKAAADAAAKEKAQQQLKRAGTVFDMQNIQIVAALQGKVTEEQRLRLVALLAINNDNADAADKLTQAILALQAPALNSLGITLTTSDNATTVIQKLIDAQTKLFLLNSGIASIPKAKNPFEDWKSILDAILGQIDQIISKITNLPKPTLPGGTPGGTGGTGGDTPPPPPPRPKGSDIGMGAVGRGEYGTPPFVGGGNYPAGVGGSNIMSSVARGEYSNQVWSTLISAGIGAIGRGEYQNTTDLPGMAYTNVTATPGLGAVSRGEYTAITVNVAGNVTSESDLISAIQDGLYLQQKTGKRVTLSSTSI